MMRRHLFRMLRLRNLLMLTIIVILLYLVKMLSNLDVSVYEGNTGHEALQVPDRFRNVDYFVPRSLKKKDWHNYTQIHYESTREGIGEQGRPANLTKEEADIEEQLYAVNGFNGALSDKIPLNRSLPDIRHPKCKTRQYIESLPTVSVVVPFHNEHWSTLLRTAFSVLYRSPHHLIKEIFLVDDASTKEFLGAKLDAYLATHMPKVSVVRLAQRSGLITARLAGARRASGDVLVFLDSHTEPTVNWLPPLLEPIALDRRTVVCPFIDVIAFDTFEYRAQDAGARGAFDWELFYKRLPVLPADEDNMPEPFQSPVMAGGLFAIARSFFWELGGYDPGLDIWGGEQYELSFKIWQCGGRMVDAPCSRVGHIYRKFAPFPNPGHGDFVGKIWQCGGRMVDAPCSRVGHIYRKFAPFPNPGHGDFVGKNYRRVAEVWMDEYAEHLYARRPHYRAIDPGDLTEQRALRERLRCKSFRWFMTQIAFDLSAKYPPVEPTPFADGRVRPAGAPSLCADAAHGEQMERVQLRRCAAAAPENNFLFSWHRDIRCKDRNMCWDLPESAPWSPVLLFSCHLGGGNQLWRYLPETKQIKHGTSNNCVEYSLSPPSIYINACAATDAQRWELDRVAADLAQRWEAGRDRVTGPLEEV